MMTSYQATAALNPELVILFGFDFDDNHWIDVSAAYRASKLRAKSERNQNWDKEIAVPLAKNMDFFS